MLDPTRYIQTITNYRYDTTKLHYQLTGTTTINSRNETIEEVYKYPSDVVLQDQPELARQLMVSKNILTPVIEKSVTNNNQTVSRTVNNYGIFGGLPLLSSTDIQIKNHPLEKRVTFTNYDIKGNWDHQRNGSTGKDHFLRV